MNLNWNTTALYCRYQTVPSQPMVKLQSLQKNELKILHLLMQNKGTIQSRDELINALWQTDEFIDDNTLTVNINRLRKKLESIGVTNYLKTKRGMGYIV